LVRQWLGYLISLLMLHPPTKQSHSSWNWPLEHPSHRNWSLWSTFLKNSPHIVDGHLHLPLGNGFNFPISWTSYPVTLLSEQHISKGMVNSGICIGQTLCTLSACFISSPSVASPSLSQSHLTLLAWKLSSLIKLLPFLAPQHSFLPQPPRPSPASPLGPIST